jgi:hypothetical protein
MRKLSDADVAQIREMPGEGLSASQIADQFGVSRRHIGRILLGQARPQLGGLDRDLVTKGNVRSAVDRFLADLNLDPADVVRAETARTLATKLDQAGGDSTAASSTSAPHIARQLIDVIEDLRGGNREPDQLDLIRKRRDARRLAMAAENN